MQLGELLRAGVPCFHAERLPVLRRRRSCVRAAMGGGAWHCRSEGGLFAGKSLQGAAEGGAKSMTERAGLR